MTELIQGGLNVSDEHEKLDEVSQKTKTETDAIILYVGSCDFPMDWPDALDANYMHYVDMLTSMSTQYPKTIILLSNIPLRMGNSLQK